MYALSALKTRAFRGAYTSRRNINHLSHALLTLATFGLWLPVWLYFCLKREGWKHSHNWVVAGRPYVGLKQIERMEVSPELLHSMRRRGW